MVVGARPRSLGAALVTAVETVGWEATTAGVSGEQFEVDLLGHSSAQLYKVLMNLRPQHIVCTAGINIGRQSYTNPDVRDWWDWHFQMNVIGPMRLLEAMKAAEYTTKGLLHFVAISSNSARLPRTQSAAYCASKAALSMALRVSAREARGGDHGYIVYGYEPGLLAGTPMTLKAAGAFSGPLTRMRGALVQNGIDPGALAAQIVAGLQIPGAALNGVMVGYDADEL